MIISGSPFAITNSTDNTAQIPTPNLKIEKTTADTRAVLKVLWRAENTIFLDYEPEIWLFAYKYSRLRPVIQPDFSRIKENKGRKWVHPTHMDGTKHLGESKYAGQVITNATVITVLKQQPIISDPSYFYKPSEFPLPPQDIWQTIDIEPDKYFYTYDDNGDVRILQDIFDNFTPPKHIQGILGGKNLDAQTVVKGKFFRRFRFAISIKKGGKYYFSNPSEEFYIRRFTDQTTPDMLTLRLV